MKEAGLRLGKRRRLASAEAEQQLVEGTTMADNPWTSRAVLELDVSAAAVFVETPERTPRLGGRWLVYDTEVWWELPDGGGYQRSVYKPDAFPGVDFTPAQ